MATAKSMKGCGICMKFFDLKARAKVMAVLLASTGTFAVGNFALGSQPAGADPAAVTAENGVGSDTIQDLFNAYSGAEPPPPSALTKYYPAMHDTLFATNNTVNSWDAVPANSSIITKYGGNAFCRPNGSSNGIAALSHAIDGTNWNQAAACPTTPVSGDIDFARSSRPPNSTTGNALTYIPFAGDAVSYAAWDGTANSGVADSLTTAQLRQLYGSPNLQLVVGADTIKGCITQSGSGTTKFWETAMLQGANDAALQAASQANGCPANLEENGGNSFDNAVVALAPGANTDYVVDFSAGSWVSQANGAAVDRSNTARADAHIHFGSPDGVAPFNPIGGPPPLTPNAAFYSSAVYGRNLYVVVDTHRITRRDPLEDHTLEGLFVGGTSAICSAPQQPAELNTFGFVQLGAGVCGSTTTTGPLYS